MRFHHTHNNLINPVHKITIDLVGLGGTGSSMLNNLARMNQALMGLGHPGIHIRAWDPDEVTIANAGRQLFSPADIAQNKSIVLVTRVNRYFGFSWEARPELYHVSMNKKHFTSNILITCVDTAKARLVIGDKLKIIARTKFSEPTDQPYYWLDIGNLQKTGQCVLGTVNKISQPRKKGYMIRAVLDNVIEKFPSLKTLKEENQGPSCSLAEALGKQDLFINSTLAQFGCNLLWKLIKDGVIKQHGCYVNLDTLSVNPIKI